MKNLIYLILTLCLVQSCSKERKGDKVTITGTIVTDCAGTPFANKELSLYNIGNRTLNTNREEVYFTTDENGYFSAECSTSDAVEYVDILIGGSGGRSILQFYTQTDLNIGTLNTTPTANYQIKIKVNNPYSVGDTLGVIDHKGGGTYYKFAAPLTDTVLNIVNNYSNGLQIPNLENKNKVLIEPTSNIYSGLSGTSSFISIKTDYNTFYLEGCQTILQEVTVTID